MTTPMSFGRQSPEPQKHTVTNFMLQWDAVSRQLSGIRRYAIANGVAVRPDGICYHTLTCSVLDVPYMSDEVYGYYMVAVTDLDWVTNTSGHRYQEHFCFMDIHLPPFSDPDTDSGQDASVSVDV